MSLNVALNSATMGLRALTEALANTSNNINNANTPGYSRRVANLQTSTAGNVTNGALVKSITRQVDANLQRQSNLAAASLANLEVLKRYGDEVVALFGRPADGGTLARQITQLSRAFEDLASAPQSGPVQTALVQNAGQFARSFQSTAAGIQDMRQEVDTEIGRTIAAVNEKLGRLHELNAQLSNGATDLTLRDGRDRLVGELSALIGIKTFERSTGELVVTSDSGAVLLDKSVRLFEEYVPRPNVSEQTEYGAGGTISGFDDIRLADDPTDITRFIRGGRLEALIRLRDDVLPGAQRQIDQLAGAVAEQVNQAHNRGTSLPAPPSLTGSQRFAGATAVSFAGDLTVALLGLDGQAVASVTVAGTPLPGSTTLSALLASINAGLPADTTATLGADGRVTLATTRAGHGVALVDRTLPDELDITYVPAGGTRPQSAKGFSSLLGLNDFFGPIEASPKYTSGLLAASPSPLPTAAFEVTTVPAGAAAAFTMAGTPQDIVAAINTGAAGAAVRAAGVTARLYRDGDRVGVHLEGPPGFRVAALAADGYGFAPASNGAARALAVRSDIAGDPIRVARGQLRPADLNNDGTVDGFGVGQTDTAAAQGVAAALLARRNFAAGGGLAGASLSVGDYAASIIDRAAREADRLDQAHTFQEDVVNEIGGRIGAISDVDLDAELAQLVTLQNSYAATARVISTVNALFDALERAV